MDLINELVMNVENILAAELRKMRGTVLNDGWTANAVHFVGIFASSMVWQPV